MKIDTICLLFVSLLFHLSVCQYMPINYVETTTVRNFLLSLPSKYTHGCRNVLISPKTDYEIHALAVELLKHEQQIVIVRHNMSTVLKKLDRQNAYTYCSNYFFWKMSPKEIIGILEVLQPLDLPQDSRFWYFVSNAAQLSLAKSALVTEIFTQSVMVNPCDPGCTVKALDVYGGTIEKWKIKGKWEASRGWVLQHPFFWDKFSNLDGKSLVVATLPYNPCVIKNGEAPEDYGGYDISLLRIIAHHLNFKWSVNPPSDGSWGSLKPDGNWTGLIGHASSHQSHISMSCIDMSNNRWKAIDFSYPVVFDAFLFVGPLPRFSPKWKALLQPFNFELWISIGLTYVIIALLSELFVKFLGPKMILHWLEQENANDPRLEKAANRRYKVYFPSFYMFGVQLSEPIATVPISMGMQTFVGFWMVYCLVLNRSYGGNLTAFLTKQAREAPIDTFSSLAATDVAVEIHDYGGSQLSSYFTKSTSEYLRAIGERATAENNIKVGLENVKTKYSAYFDYYIGIQPTLFRRYTDEYNRLEMLISKDRIISLYAFALNLKSPLKNRVDFVIQQLYSSGIIQKMYASVDPAIDNSSVVTALSLEHLQGLFYLTGLCIALSLLVFGVEICGKLKTVFRK